MSTCYPVVVVGSCMIDLVSYTTRLPKPGETLQGTKFTIGFGGKGANQCVTAARLGATTAMVAMVGDDNFGRDYLQNFKSNGIITDYISQTKEAGTGVAPIVVDENGQNSIIIVSGANLLISPSIVRNAESLLKQAVVLICQLEINMDATLEALKLAKKHNVTSILNAAPGVANLDPFFLTLPDIFCVNETEAEIITELHVESVDHARVAMSKLLKMGCQTVIITLGDKGVVFGSENLIQFDHVPVKQVKPVDSSGAGDAFVGALAYYLAYYPKLALKEKIQRACSIASLTVQTHGTQSSYSWRKDLSAELFQQ